MARSAKKGPFVDPTLLKRVYDAKKKAGNSQVKTWSRRSMVIPDFVGSTILSVKYIAKLADFKYFYIISGDLHFFIGVSTHSVNVILIN